MKSIKALSRILAVCAVLIASTPSSAQTSDGISSVVTDVIASSIIQVNLENYSEAESILEKYLHDSDSPQVRLKLAQIQIQAGQYSQALSNYKILNDLQESDLPCSKFELKNVISELEIDSEIEWISQTIAKWSRPGRPSYIPSAKETKTEAIARYRLIARDVAYIVYDPKIEPIFRGKRGRTNTVALVLSIAFHESGFRKDVDFGTGSLARGDKGRSWCFMQLNIGTGKTAEGWFGQDLVDDRTKCFKSGLSVVRRSMSACKKLSMLDRLSAYATGSCKSNQPHSRSRMGLMVRLIASIKPNLDVDIQKVLFPTPVVTLQTVSFEF